MGGAAGAFARTVAPFSRDSFGSALSYAIRETHDPCELPDVRSLPASRQGTWAQASRHLTRGRCCGLNWDACQCDLVRTRGQCRCPRVRRRVNTGSLKEEAVWADTGEEPGGRSRAWRTRPRLWSTGACGPTRARKDQKAHPPGARRRTAATRDAGLLVPIEETGSGVQPHPCRCPRPSEARCASRDPAAALPRGGTLVSFAHFTFSNILKIGQV